MRKMLVACATVLCAVLSPAFALPKYNIPITVTGYSGTETLENFPVLVRLAEKNAETGTGIEGFSYQDCAADGADIAFTLEDGKTVLPREIEKWDTSGESLIWVRVPALSNGLKIICTYCDKNVTAQPASQTDGSVWKSAGYVGVWHMDEASGTVRDSAGNGLFAEPKGDVNVSVAVDGPIGNGRQTGTSEKGYLSIANYEDFGVDGAKVGNSFTVSGFVKLTAVMSYPRLFSRKIRYQDANGWEIEMASGSSANFSARGANNPTYSGTFQKDLKGDWSHVALVYNDTNLKVYQNGVLIKDGTINAAVDNALPMSIGCDSDGNETHVQGSFDECRLIDAVVSADWLKAEFDQSNAAFFTYDRVTLCADDSALTIEGNLGEYGTSSPTYGVANGYSVGQEVTLTMQETSVTIEEDRYTLIGWELYSINLESGEETRVDWYGKDADDLLNTYTYAYNGCAKFKWIWKKQSPLSVATPVACDVTTCSADVSVLVGGIGFTAPSATLTIVYGLTPDAMVYTKTFTITDPTTITTSLLRLTPNHVYFVKALLETSDGAKTESELVSFTTGKTVSGTPGLYQTFFKSANKDWTKDIWSLPEGTDWKNYNDDNRIRRPELTTWGAYTTVNQKQKSELWGDDIYWVNGGQFAYAGYIYLDAAKSYKFRTKIDDNEYLAITDSRTGVKTVLINDVGGANTVQTSSSHTPSVTGYHEIEIRFSDGSGGAGGYSTGSNYKNTENAGYSDDNGASWKLMSDPGDGSLFMTGVNPIRTKEVRQNGVLTAIDIEFAAASSARTLSVAYASTDSGNDLASWPSKSDVAIIAANATSYRYTLPSNWGSDENCAMRFYFDGGESEWSGPVFWQDSSLPVLDDVTLDGTGGDTLVVSGNLVSFKGSKCTLSVYVGKSVTEFDHVWTGLQNSVRTSTGEFSLTLFESDKDAARSFKPGETYSVFVVATANGKVASSSISSVTMSSAAVFASAASAVSRRTVTFTGRLGDIGANNSSEVSLYVGSENDENSLVQVEDTITVTSVGDFSIKHTFDEFEKTYYWQFRAVNQTTGGTSDFETRTEVVSCKTLDSTTYTWKNGLSAGHWSDPNCWENNQGGDCLSFPQTTAATVSFASGTKATITLDSERTIGYLKLTAGNTDITFVNGGASTNENKVTINSLELKGNRDRVVFDGVAIVAKNGLEIGTGTQVILQNGANFHCANLTHKLGGFVSLFEDSWFSFNELYFGGGEILINDSTLVSRYTVRLGDSVVGGRVRFEGTHPLWYHAHKDANFSSTLANANVQLDFLVPVGGFDAPPIQAISTISRQMGNDGNNAGKCAITVNVLDESPANYADETIASPLISWEKGISQTMILEGNLPKDNGVASDDAFVWDAENSPPKTLAVSITGNAHVGDVLISSSSDQVAAGTISPTYGYTSISEGAQILCSVPEGYITISDVKRAVCTGWKLYEINHTTKERTLLDAGNGVSCTQEYSDTWRELEWQWKIEYKVSVTSSGNGTVAVSNEWIEDGSKAIITATPNEGYGFTKWTGDVSEENNKSNPLTIAVDGQGYNLEAGFVKAYYVSPTGDDTYPGTSWDDAFATIEAALAKDPNAFIYVADGIYEVTSMITISGSATISGTSDRCGAIFRASAKIADGSIFRLANADARLYRIAITSAYSGNGDFARGVHFKSAGLVDSCVITNCRSHYMVYWGGGGAYLEGGGIVRNTIFDNNSTYASGGNNASGHNIAINGNGLVENCVITRGGAWHGASSSVGGVLIEGGTLRNSLIAYGTQGHDNTDGATGVKIKNGTIENCTIVANSHPGSINTKGLYIAGAAKIRNTVIWGNKNTSGTANWAAQANVSYTAENNCTIPAMPGQNNITTAPAFIDEESGDFRLTLCDLVDKGQVCEWMAYAEDLAGEERVSGVAPDIGCYEFTAGTINCGFNVSQSGNLNTDQVTFTAIVQGSNLSGLTYTWTWTDAFGNVTTESGSDLSMLTIDVPIGIYDVTLTVSNSNGDTAASTRNDCISVKPSDIYLDVNGKNIYPFNSYENGCTNILEALEYATDATTLHLNDGWHRVSDTINLSKGITLVSENGPDKTFVYGEAKTSGMPVILISNKDAMLSGITLTGKDADNSQKQKWGGMRISSAGGTVTNCVIANHKTVNNTVPGSGGRIEGGLVVDCIFTNNFTKCSGGAGTRGGAILLNGVNAVVDRCIIASNTLSDGGTSFGGGVCINSGTLRNSLILKNYCINYGGGVALMGANAKISHCTIVNNTAGTGSGGVHLDSGTIKDCLVWGNVVNGTQESGDDPGFVNAAAGDFHLNPASSAIDAGSASADNLLDLEKNPRVSGSASDKGCYEYDQNQFSLGISYEKLGTFAPSQITLTAKVMPSTASLDSETTWWTIDGTEPSSDNYFAKGATVTAPFEAGIYTVRFKTIYNGTEYTIDNTDWIVQHPETVYVVEGNETPQAPYATIETAASSLYDGLSFAIEDATLLVGDGLYEVKSSINLDRKLTIRSVNGPEKTTFSGGGANVNILTAGVVIDGIRFYGSDLWQNGFVNMSDSSLVTNCIFDSCCVKNSGGAGVTMTAGTVSDSVFTNCYVKDGGAEQPGAAIKATGKGCLIERTLVVGSYESNQTCGNGAVYIKDGVVRNTVVSGNKLKYGGGIVADGTAEICNCTVINNESLNSGYTGGITAGSSAKVYNTISMDNINSADKVASNVSGDEGCYSHCAVPGKYGANSVDVVNPFSPLKSRKYMLHTNSECRDAGENQSWMKTGVDFFGKPRIYGLRQRVDIGAAECDKPFSMILILK